MQAKYEVSQGSKVIAKVKVDNRSDRQADKQKRQKLSVPDNLILGIKYKAFCT